MLKRNTRYQAAIVRDHHVLLLRAVERDGTTFWLPPGGGREGAETAVECVCREVLEETTLTVEIERFLFAEEEPPGTMYQCRHTYLCRILGGTASPGVEPEFDTNEHASIQEVGWFDLLDPTTWPSPPAMGKITPGWLEKLRSALDDA